MVGIAGFKNPIGDHLICYVWSVLLYGAETWTLNAVLVKRLQPFEMWYWRRMLNISWKKKLTNERVFQMAGENRRLLYTIQRRKKGYFGHVMRHNELLRVIMEGKVEGTKPRGGQRKILLGSVRTEKVSHDLLPPQEMELYMTFVVKGKGIQGMYHFSESDESRCEGFFYLVFIQEAS